MVNKILIADNFFTKIQRFPGYTALGLGGFYPLQL